MKVLYKELSEIKAMLKGMVSQKSFLTAPEAAKYLNFSIGYLYKLTHLGVLPFYRPNGKKIFLKRVELDEWISQHKSKSLNQIKNETK